MKMKISRIAVLAAAFLLGQAALSAEDYPGLVNLTINKWDGVFAAGEKISIHADMNYDFADGAAVIVTLNGKEVSCDTIFTKQGKRLLYEKSFDKPVAGIVSVMPVGDSLRLAQVGFIVEPEGFKPGSRRPSDLKRFWKKQIKAMRAIPMHEQLKTIRLEGEDADRFVCYEFIVNGPDSIPCRGYAAMPKDASPGSLPLYLYAHAAGVSKPHCRAKASHALEMAKTGSGCIGIDMNAHGLPDDQPLEYYRDQENGRLKDYSRRIITDHESYYFRTMFLRMVRALDYFCSWKQWDGRRVLVQGESQGGAQSAAVAGLDKRVSAIVLQVPAMFDTEGELAGRLSGWPKPLQTQDQSEAARTIAPYYDNAHLVKGIKASMHVEIGLIDPTCPPTGIYAGINQAKGDKHIYPYPYRTHQQPGPSYIDEWRERILKQRIKFIEDYLK